MNLTNAKLTYAAVLAIWQAALSEPIGILIRTNDVTTMKAKLYRVRKKSQILDLMRLQIRTSPFPDGDLVICHSGKIPAIKPTTNLAQIDLGNILDLDDE